MPTNTPPQNQNTRKIRPCRSICHNVEKKCPYLLPGDRAPAHPTQYAGQSTFLCRGESFLALNSYLESKQVQINAISIIWQIF